MEEMNVGDIVYCKYCYEDREVDIGPDGSIWVCTVCGSGLALVEDFFDEDNSAVEYSERPDPPDKTVERLTD